MGKSMMEIVQKTENNYPVINKVGSWNHVKVPIRSGPATVTAIYLPDEEPDTEDKLDELEL